MRGESIILTRHIRHILWKDLSIPQLKREQPANVHMFHDTVKRPALGPSFLCFLCNFAELIFSMSLATDAKLQLLFPVRRSRDMPL
jgi:hypothetical protein